MRRITALPIAIALVALLAGAPATATSVEDERTEAIIAAVVGQDANASVVAAPAPPPIAATAGSDVILDTPTAPSPDAPAEATSSLFSGDVLYDLDTRQGPGPGAVPSPLDAIPGFAQGRVIGLHTGDLGEVRVSN